MDGHTVFERGHADEGVVTASETGGLLFLSLCFAWFLLPLRLLASHLNALDLERCPDLGADNNLCIPLGATVDGEEALVGLACSKRLAHMCEAVHKSNCRDAPPRHRRDASSLVDFHTGGTSSSGPGLCAPPTTSNLRRSFGCSLCGNQPAS